MECEGRNLASVYRDETGFVKWCEMDFTALWQDNRSRASVLGV